MYRIYVYMCVCIFVLCSPPHPTHDHVSGSQYHRSIHPPLYQLLQLQVDLLLGDPAKAKKVLGWEVEVSFDVRI